MQRAHWAADDKTAAAGCKAAGAGSGAGVVQLEAQLQAGIRRQVGGACCRPGQGGRAGGERGVVGRRPRCRCLLPEGSSSASVDTCLPCKAAHPQSLCVCLLGSCLLSYRPASAAPQQQRRQQRQVRSADAAPSSSGSGWMDMPESTPLEEAVEVFPRLKERDPYK